MGAAVPYIIKAAGSSAGTTYNVYEGLRNADRASDWEKKQAASLNALTQLSQQQWDNYKKLYAPNIKKAIAETVKAPDYQGAEDAASVAGVRQADRVYGAAALEFAARGISPASGAAKAALRGLATTTALGQAGARIDARNAANDVAFNNRLGIVTTGRGQPGEIMRGYGALADSTGSIAAGYRNLSAENFGTAANMSSIGNWTGK